MGVICYHPGISAGACSWLLTPHITTDFQACLSVCALPATWLHIPAMGKVISYWGNMRLVLKVIVLTFTWVNHDRIMSDRIIPDGKPLWQNIRLLVEKVKLQCWKSLEGTLNEDEMTVYLSINSLIYGWPNSFNDATQNPRRSKL